jgi:hypothetical protein
MTTRNGDAPEAEERAPTAAWMLTDDLSLEDELSVRRWALEGLNRHGEQEEST